MYLNNIAAYYSNNWRWIHDISIIPIPNYGTYITQYLNCSTFIFIYWFWTRQIPIISYDTSVVHFISVSFGRYWRKNNKNIQAKAGNIVLSLPPASDITKEYHFPLMELKSWWNMTYRAWACQNHWSGKLIKTADENAEDDLTLPRLTEGFFYAFHRQFNRSNFRAID